MIRITRTVESEHCLQEYISTFSVVNNLIDRHLSKTYLNLFARPQQAEDGAVEWYSEINGKPQRFNALNVVERDKIAILLSQKLAALTQLHQTLSTSAQTSPETLQLLTKIARQPSPERIWIVDGQPVITGWDIMPATKLPAEQLPKKRGWLWLGLLALALLLALVLLRGCWPTVKVVTPAVSPVQPAPEHQVKMLCPAQRTKQQAPEMVIIFDASGSMAMSMDATPEEIMRWMQDKPVPGIDREPRRITLAHQSAKHIIDDVPNDMDISLIAAANCHQVSATPAFLPEQRAELKKLIDKIQPVGKTALAEALEEAGKRVNGVDRDAIILLVTDGEETCGGSPCDVALELKKRKPRLQVNVVDIMNTGAGNCIASNTGGKVFAVNNTQEFNKMMNNAVKEYIPQGCD